MQSFAHHHHKEAGEAQAGETAGLVMNWGWRYDLLVWFFDTVLLRGKLQGLRQRTIDLAQLQPGEAVLDVGCGTGTLALQAYALVGAAGRVCGIDPGPRQIDRARAKAARRSFPIDLQVGVIEQLAFPDQSFDVVLSTLMMHHLPEDLKRQVDEYIKQGAQGAVVYGCTGLKTPFLSEVRPPSSRPIKRPICLLNSMPGRGPASLSSSFSACFIGVSVGFM